MANGLLTYCDITVDPNGLPEVSQHALMRYGLAHFLGNVQASKMVARIRGKDGLDNAEAGSDVVSAWRKANADKVAAWAKEHLDKALTELQNGSVGAGVRVGGPRKDPVESKFTSLVLQDIIARLKGSGREGLAKAFRAAAKTGDPIDFGGVGPDGKPNVRTREQMIAATIAQHGDRLRKEAEKMVREEQRLAANAEKQAGAVEGASPEALGF